MKLAIVIPWFGRELKGGAEQHAWQLAARLAARGHAIDVLTTCCRSHQEDWETNHLPEGAVIEREGFTTRRFPVDPRDRKAFDRVCGTLLQLDHTKLGVGVSPVSLEDSQIFTSELIKSKQLLQFIADNTRNYDRFVFLPYLYGPIIAGVQLVGPRSALLPCLHDESYAYLPEVAQTFYAAGSILFISEGEQELAYRLFGPGIIEKSSLAGAGVEHSRSEGMAPESCWNKPLPKKFLLYLGRKDPGKNVPLLVSAFRRFRAVRPNSDLHLVLAGHGDIDLSGSTAIVDAGLVTDAQKEELLRKCIALVQPSQNESFSRVIMEAWFHRKPVAAHRRCIATALAVARARGGWSADEESEWAALFVEIDRTPQVVLDQLGGGGNAYASEMADWEKVVDRYEAALRVTPLVHAAARPHAFEINQFLPNLSHGDAISNEALFIRDRLRELGCRSDIFVRFIDPRVAHECQPFSREVVRRSDAIIYHHSIGTEITPAMVDYSGPKCLIYHNITPAEFFVPFRPRFAEILRDGREALHNLAPHFPISFGDSQYNADELARVGFVRPQVLPICVNPDKWRFAPDPNLMGSLGDGRTNIIFVGRIAPNKKQDDLVTAFRHYLSLDPTARLFLVGSAERDDPYAEHLSGVIRQHNLQSSVTLTGSVSDAQLAAYYHSAHLFWSMSEHEGFCVPLIESMWFDVPVLAYRSSAVPETLGNAALTFSQKASPSESAGLAHLLVTDITTRDQVIRAQRRQRRSFLPRKVVPILDTLADRLVHRVSAPDHNLPASHGA